MRVKIVKNILDGKNKFLIWEINWKKNINKRKKRMKTKMKKKKTINLDWRVKLKTMKLL